MNISTYKRYRFINITLESMKSGNIYEATIPDENDRFYHQMKQHIISQHVAGLTPVIIDSIQICNGKDRFFEDGSFKFYATMAATDQNDYVHFFSVYFDRVQFSGNPRNIDYDGNNMTVDLCIMNIQYKTDILIGAEIE